MEHCRVESSLWTCKKLSDRICIKQENCDDEEEEQEEEGKYKILLTSCTCCCWWFFSASLQSTENLQSTANLVRVTQKSGTLPTTATAAVATAGAFVHRPGICTSAAGFATSCCWPAWGGGGAAGSSGRSSSSTQKINPIHNYQSSILNKLQQLLCS